MAILVSGLRLELEENAETLKGKASKRLGIRPEQIESFHLVKKAVDARRKGKPFFVCTAAVGLKQNEQALVQSLDSPQVTLQKEEKLSVVFGDKPLEYPPVVVGFGPAGMFAALLLARNGFRPVILERGGDMQQRTQAVKAFWETGLLNDSTNVQFGEGGAGTFSDGKLTTRISDPRCRYILEELVAHGAPEEILFQAKPHVGTDRLRKVVIAIREEIIRLGGTFHFETQLLDLKLAGGRFCGVVTSRGEIPAQTVLLAIGHSARDTIKALHDRGVSVEPKAFSVGVRIEQLQADIDRGLYGEYAGHPALPKGEYQLSHREGEAGVYTFCMCPGGLVVPAASEQGGVVTNGMSYYARDGVNSNAALVASVSPADWGGEPLGGMAFQQGLERTAFAAGGGTFAAPIQTVGRFLAGRPGAELKDIAPTYASGTAPADLQKVLGKTLADRLRQGLLRFNRRLPGFGRDDAVLTGVETRTSSPVRIPRGENLQAPGIEGLYPLGEGAGYAGGIVSAAVDGLRGAQAVLALYAPLD
ncbi:hypothetical protein U6B65_01270 [Oscillospiraceae bacterium MB08-C2-2]|nr:hypothetical protein U6B65_01270 [Oscillospiraceae bacterium MB08-C2-2]